MKSLRYLTIEEVHELSEAVIGLDEAERGESEERIAKWSEEVKKELGDLMLHVLFYSKIAEDEGLFDFEAVCDAASEKLMKRHPHIALPDREGKMRAPTSKDHPGWEQVKMREGRRSVLEGVPASLPSLVKAIRLQEKAAGMGYREKSIGTEEGDALFGLIAEMRERGVNADDALSHANNRFAERVKAWEKERQQRG